MKKLLLMAALALGGWGVQADKGHGGGDDGYDDSLKRGHVYEGSNRGHVYDGGSRNKDSHKNRGYSDNDYKKAMKHAQAGKHYGQKEKQKHNQKYQKHGKKNGHQYGKDKQHGKKGKGHGNRGRSGSNSGRR